MKEVLFTQKEIECIKEVQAIIKEFVKTIFDKELIQEIKRIKIEHAKACPLYGKKNH